MPKEQQDEAALSQQQRELMEKKRALMQGGGAKAIDKQHVAGKKTARERLQKLFDEGSFQEMGLFVQHRCTNFGMQSKEAAGDGVVTGYGTINGRTVFVAAQDFTVVGGSLGQMHASKIVAAQQMALKSGAPMICINDSGGARIQEGVDALAGYGDIFYQNVKASGRIPQISVIMGPCAGGAAYSPALTDFTMMVRGTGQMFITGPEVVRSVTGQNVTMEELGGAQVHNSISGCAHDIAQDEDECIATLKALLSYLPQNSGERPAAVPTKDRADREDAKLNTLIPDSPKKPYDMMELIVSLADDGVVLEVQKEYAKNVITAFIRMDGNSIGVVASQPHMMAGCLDINASDKASRFIRMCDSFNIPLLTLQDVPGFLPGSQQEHGGIIRHGAKMIYAYAEATVPKVTLIVRKAYGGAYIGMCSKHLGADAVFAWPTAEIAVMGADGAANIIFGKEIRAAENPEAVREERIKEYRGTMMNPYVAAARGYVDDVILPSQTRKAVIRAFRALEGKAAEAVKHHHGNIPL